MKNLDPNQPIKYHEKAIDNENIKIPYNLEPKQKEERKKLKRKGSLDSLLPTVSD